MMRRFEIVVAALLAGLFPFAGAHAGDEAADPGGPSHADASSTPESNRAEGAHDQAPFAFGRPGDPAKVDRAIRIKALDSFRYDKSKLTVRAGETVRFIVTNAGKIRHEFVLGDAAEQREHEQEMRDMPAGMVMPDEANGISLAPGQTKSIVWQFAGPGTVECACHEPGHFEAGMIGRIIVEK